MMKSFPNFVLLKFGLSFSACVISQTAAFATEGSYIQQSIGKTTVFIIKEGQRPIILSIESPEQLDSEAIYELLSTGSGRFPVKITPYSAEDYYTYIHDGNNRALVETIYVVVPNSWLGNENTGNQLNKEGIIQVKDNSLLDVPSNELQTVIRQRYSPTKAYTPTGSLLGGGVRNVAVNNFDKQEVKRFNNYDEENEEEQDFTLSVKTVGKKNEENNNIPTDEYDDEKPLANLDGVVGRSNFISLEEEVSNSIGSEEHVQNTSQPKAFAGLNEKSLGIRSQKYKVKGTSDEESAALMPRDLKEVVATSDVLYTEEPEPVAPVVSELGAEDHQAQETHYSSAPGYHDRGLQHPTPVLQSSGTTKDSEPLVAHRPLKDVQSSSNIVYVNEPDPIDHTLGGYEHQSQPPKVANAPGYHDRGLQHPTPVLQSSGTTKDSEPLVAHRPLRDVQSSSNVVYVDEPEPVDNSLGGYDHRSQEPRVTSAPGYHDRGLQHPTPLLHSSGTTKDGEPLVAHRPLRDVQSSSNVVYVDEPEPIDNSLGGSDYKPQTAKVSNAPGYHDRGLQHPTPVLQSSGTTNDSQPIVAYNPLNNAGSSSNVISVNEPEPIQSSLGGDDHQYTTPAKTSTPGPQSRFENNSQPSIGYNTQPLPSNETLSDETLVGSLEDAEPEVKYVEPVNPFEGVSVDTQVITLTDNDKISAKSHTTSNGVHGYTLNSDSKDASLKVSGTVNQKNAVAELEKQNLANQSIKNVTLKKADVTTTNEVKPSIGSNQRLKQSPGSVEHTFVAQNEPTPSGSNIQSLINPNGNANTNTTRPVSSPTSTATTNTTPTAPTTPPTTSTSPATTVTQPVTSPIPPSSTTSPSTLTTPAPTTITAPVVPPTPTSATQTPAGSPTTGPTTQPATAAAPTTAPASNAAPATPNTAPNPNSAVVPAGQTPNGPENAAEPNATAQGNPKSAGANQDVLINFNNVSVIEYINFISRLTGKNFVFDQADLNFNVTIISNEPTTLNNVMQALLQALRVQGLSLMEVGNNIIIHRNKKVNAPTEVVSGDQKSNAELVTRVFRLSNTDPEKMTDIIRPMLSDLAVISPIPQTGHLIVTDLTANVNKIADLIDSLDSSTSNFQIGRYVVVNSPIEQVIGLSSKIMEPLAQGKTLTFTPDPSTNSIFVVSTPYLLQRAIAVLQQVDVQSGQNQILSEQATSEFRGAGEGLTGSQIFATQGAEIPETTVRLSNGQTETLTGGVRQGNGNIKFSNGSLSPDGTYTNANGQKNKVLEVVGGRQPATNAPPIAGRAEPIVFKIFKLRHRKGDKLADSFKKIGQSLIATGQQNTGLQYANLLATLNSVQWVEATNSLVFSGTPRVLEDIAELIDKLDVQVRQVLVEMLILSTTISDSLTYGVEWDSNWSRFNSAGSTSFLSSSSSPLNLVFSQANNINPLPGMNDQIIDVMNLDAVGLSGQTGFSLGVIGRNLIRGNYVFPTIGALVTALHNDSNSDIIMNPKIVVEENSSAEVFVGQNISYRTQSITNDQGQVITANFEYRDVGSKLKVVPYISNDDIITLEIEQELSSATQVQPQNLGGTQAATNTTVVNPVITDIGPNTNKATTTTKVHMPDRYFLILSGMISDQTDLTRAQVPCLGGVPVLGAAFSQSRYSKQKQNVMIFIRPQIIENDEIHRATKRQQDLYIERTRILDREDFEVDQALDFFNLKHICDPNRWTEYNWSP